MSILLDTNACIALINGRPRQVRERFRRALDRSEMIVVSTVTLFELWYGIAKSAQVAANTAQLAAFLSSVVMLPFDVEDARVAGSIRATLQRIGQPIGPYDCLIAGQAVRQGFLLVTANIGEFARVDGLRFENWSA